MNFAKIFRTPFLTEQHLFLQNTSAGCFCQESLNWNNQADADVSQNKTKYVRFENQVVILPKEKQNKQKPPVRSGLYRKGISLIVGDSMLNGPDEN